MHSLCFVFSQDLLKSLDALLRNLVKGSTAGAYVVAQETGGCLYDGIGISIFKAGAEALDAFVGLFGFLDLSLREQVVNGGHGVGIYVGAACDTAGAAC